MGQIFKGIQLRLKRVLTHKVWFVLLALLLAWMVYVPIYNIWREPRNVFEEMYWGLIDMDCASALFMEHGLYWPGEYGFAAFNPFREKGMENLELEKCSSGFKSLYRGAGGEKLEGNPAKRFPSFYGSYRYPSTGNSLQVQSYQVVFGYDILFHAVEERASDEADCDVLQMVLRIAISEDQTENTVYARVYFNYSMAKETIDVDLSATSGMSYVDIRNVAKEVLFKTFLSEYFTVNQDSKFSLDDVGNWSWGKLETEEMSDEAASFWFL